MPSNPHSTAAPARAAHPAHGNATSRHGMAREDAPRDGAPTTILRFRVSERMMHWSLAAPFVLLYGSALLMFALWSEPAPRPIHAALGLVHRLAGLLLIVLPPLALFLGSPDWRVHARNLKEGWVWTRDDVRWLLLFPRAAVDHRVRLPEQGKFNAAEKLNFMMVMVTYPLYIATGSLIWAESGAFVPWVAHAASAVIGLPLIAGHLFMAMVNPGTRIGLSGMITGRVDRAWARHHYRRWYREQFERAGDGAARPMVPLLARPALVRCGSCHAHHAFQSWEALIERAFRVEPLFCSACGAELKLVSAEPDHGIAGAVLDHLEQKGADRPLPGAA